MLASKKLLIVIVVVALIIVVGLFTAYQSGYFNPAKTQPTPSPETTLTSSATPEPSPSQEFSIQETVRNSVMVYIGTNHAELAQWTQSLTWAGGRETTGGLGAETYTYSSGNWTLQIKYPVVPNPTYSVTANHSQADSSATWQGTYQEGNITETIYTNSALSMQEQARNDIVNYLRVNHTETQPHLQALVWTGGRTTPEGIVGAETYRYQSVSLSITMQFPVVPNAVYTVTAEYVAPHSATTSDQNVFSWEGTWQNHTINETSYTYNP